MIVVPWNMVVILEYASVLVDYWMQWKRQMCPGVEIEIAGTWRIVPCQKTSLYIVTFFVSVDTVSSCSHTTKFWTSVFTSVNGQWRWMDLQKNSFALQEWFPKYYFTLNRNGHLLRRIHRVMNMYMPVCIFAMTLRMKMHWHNYKRFI